MLSGLWRALIVFEKMASLAPHRGHVELFQCAHDNCWYLRHGLSQELCGLSAHIAHEALPELVYDDEGYGFVSQGVDGDMLDVSELLQFDVLQAPSGEVAIEFGSESEPNIKWLHNMSVDYERVGLIAKGLGPHAISAEFELAFYRHPRHGCGNRLMWSWPDLVRAFRGGVKTVVGEWLRKKWDAWVRCLDGKNCGDVLKAQPYARENTTIDSSRNVPWRAGSTCAVLFLLARLAHADKSQQGGVENEEMRARIAVLLEALLGMLVLAPDWSLSLCLDDHAVVKPWPCRPQGRGPLTCAVKSGVLMWPACEGRQWHRGAPAAWVEVGRVAPDGASRLVELIPVLAANGSKVAKFLEQVVSQAGRQLDSFLAGCFSSEDAQSLLAPTWKATRKDCFFRHLWRAT